MLKHKLPRCMLEPRDVYDVASNPRDLFKTLDIEQGISETHLNVSLAAVSSLATPVQR